MLSSVSVAIARKAQRLESNISDGARGDAMGLVKTRRLAAMQKMQRAKAGMKPPMKGAVGKGVPRQFATAPKAHLKAF